MKTTIALLFAIFLLSGCSAKTPPIAEYRIATQKSETPYDAKSCRDKNIKIALSFSQNGLMTQKMKYAKGDFAEFEFNKSQWSQSPNRAIAQAILQSVRDTKLFRSVQNHKSRSASEYILESNIEEFIQHFDAKESGSYAVVKISFALVDAKSSHVVESLTLSQRVKTKELNAKGGVEALSMALNEVLQEKNLWLNRVCQ